MIGYLVRLMVCAAAVYLAPRYLNQISVKDFQTAFIVALVLSLLNGFVKPILSILTFPINLLTLGLFSFVINVVIIYVAAHFVNGFKVQGFVQPLIFSFVISIASWVAGLLND